MSTASHTLSVIVDVTQLPVLKAAGFRLCIAKKINNTYSVVWSGEDFLQQNVFQWFETYQIFAAQEFKAGARVESLGDAQTVRSGQVCVMDKHGLLSNAFGALDDGGSFQFVNLSGPTYLGVNCRVNGQDQPVFVGSDPIAVNTVVQITPGPTVKVWFDKTLKTGFMFSGDVVDSVEASFDSGVVQSVLYVGEKPGSPEKWVHLPPVADPLVVH